MFYGHEHYLPTCESVEESLMTYFVLSILRKYLGKNFKVPRWFLAIITRRYLFRNL